VADLVSALKAGDLPCTTRVVVAEFQARQYARRADLAVVGTVGILVRALQKGLLGQVEAQKLLNWKIVAGYRSPIRKLDEIL
jgi:predicted nucleic acid-binding protein